MSSQTRVCPRSLWDNSIAVVVETVLLCQSITTNMIRALSLLLFTLTTVNAQIVSYVNVCYPENGSVQDAQEFCRSVRDCYDISDEEERLDTAVALNCFMRCDDPDGEGFGIEPFKCEEHGMTCHHDRVCIVPPAHDSLEDGQ